MTTKDDGGPFHPCECECLSDGRIDGIQTSSSRFIHTGASLRDHFAGLAMAAIIPDTQLGFDAICAEAYQYADAMIAAREQRT